MSSEMIPSLSVLILVSVAMAHDYNANLTLHFSEREYVLLQAWKTGSFLGMFGSTLIVFLICIVHEALEGLRYFLAREHMLGSPETETVSQSSVKPLSDLKCWELPRKIRNSFTGYRVTQALLYGVQTLIGYLLILIVVSFNVWLILAVVLGKAAGTCSRDD
uniref:Copper transport protein n=1 Tax=Acrobeloides nanus TaxID=290746 RepID=A0A914C3E4_9BILA